MPIMTQEIPATGTDIGLLNSVGVPLLLIQEHIIVFANTAAETLTGYSADYLIGLPVRLLLHPADADVVEAWQQGQTVPGKPVQLQTAGGGMVRVECLIAPASFRGQTVWLLTLVNLTPYLEEIEALRQSEQQFRALAENNPDVTVRCDRSLRYLYANPALRKRLGKTMDEMLGKTMQEMHLPPDQIHEVEQAIARAVETRQLVELETYLPQPTGTIHFDTRIVPEFDEAGNVVSTVLYSRDITRRKQVEQALRQSEERLRVILDNMPVMLDAYDAEGCLAFWNRECERVTGYTAAEVIGRPNILDVFYDEAERQRMRDDDAKYGLNFRNRERTFICKDGSKRLIAWSNISSEIPIPGWHSWGVGVDITERKQVDDLQRTQERLQLELQKEHELRAIGNQMLTILNHAFRTPMAVIQTSAEMLERYAERLTEERRTQHIFLMKAQISRMTTMLETIATIVGIQQREIVPALKPVDVADLCRQAMERLQRTGKVAHQFDFHLEGSDFQIQADQTYLWLALNQLLVNAVQYSAPAIPVAVLLTGDEDRVTVHIADGGTGIPAKEQPRLFEPFYRGSNAVEVEGNGLGLPLAKAIIEMHAGTLAIVSTVNQGTHVTMSLPRRQ